MKLLDKIERKIGKYAIKNLAMYIVVLNAAIYIMTLTLGNSVVRSNLALIPGKLFQEPWRIITYVFIPPQTSLIFILFVLMFMYMIGTGLERTWGSFKFNVYYILGMIGTTLAALITNGARDAFYLNMSLLLAFAYLYPDFEIRLMLVLPVKMKFLGWLDAIYLIYMFFTGNQTVKLAIVASIVNFLIFFGKDILYWIKTRTRTYYRKSGYSPGNKKKEFYHKCHICKRTENDDYELEFRYCSKCNGHYEYCMEHLKNHEHIK